jgi:hypothetical protein
MQLMEFEKVPLHTFKYLKMDNKPIQKKDEQIFELIPEIEPQATVLDNEISAS